MAVGIFVEGDKVILDLQRRRRDVLLNCGQAEELVHQLRRAADMADAVPPSLVRGQTWDAKVQSYDGFVAVRFIPPDVGAPTHVPLPPRAARQLANQVAFAAQQARWKMRFDVRN